MYVTMTESKLPDSKSKTDPAPQLTAQATYIKHRVNEGVQTVYQK